MGGPGPTPSVTVADALDVFREMDEPCTPLTASEVAETLGCARRTAHRKLKRLAERGDLETKKVGARSRVWWQPTDRPSGAENGTREAGAEPAHNQFADFVSAVKDYAIFTLDPDGHVVSWNEGATRIKGYTEDEIVGEHYSIFYTDDSVNRGAPTENLEIAAEQGRLEDEGWRVRNDGSKFWANVVITAIHDDDGNLLGFTKVTRDMTEQMYTERERQLNRSVSAAIARAPTIEDGMEAVIEDICELTEWEYGEAWLPSDTNIERVPATYADSERLERFADASVDIDFEPGDGIVGRVWQSGSPEWIRDVSSATGETFRRVDLASEVGCKAVLGVPVVSEDSVAAVLLFAMTERREVDDRLTNIVESVADELGGLVSRKQTEAALRRERELLDRILEASPVGISVLDPDGTITRSNPRGMELLGLTEGDPGEIAAGERVVLDEAGEPIPPEERPFSSVFESGEPVYEWVCQIEQPDGERRWVSINAAPIRDDDGEIERVVASGEDITKVKKQAQRLARQSEELESELREVYERVEDAFYALDQDWRFTYLNDRAEELLERSEEDLIGESIWNAFPEAAETEAREKYDEAMETQEPISFELFYDPLDIWVEAHAYPSESGLSVYFRDVTARKEREQQLERYETIIETMQDGVYTIDPNGRFQMVNEAYEELTGYSRGELVGSPASMVVDESTVEEARALEADLLSGERETTTLEAQIQRADGEWVSVEGSFSIIPSETASEHGYRRVGVVRDITDRKERERKLRESEERYRSLTDDVLDTSEVGTFILDADFDIVWMNQSMGEYFALDRDAVIGRDKRSLIQDDISSLLEDPDRFADLVTATYEDNTYTEEFECHVLPGDGREERWLKHWSQPIESGLYEGGRIEHYTDITERKQREQDLEEYERIVETVDDGVYVLDGDGRFQRVNEAFVSMTQFDRTELLGAHAAAVFGEQFHTHDEEARELFESGEIDVATFEEEIFTKADETITVESRFKLLEVEHGWGRVGVVRDITDRKEYERELRRYETLIEESTDVNAIVDAEGTIEYITPSVEYVLGYEPGELIGESTFDFIHEDDRNRVQGDFAALVEGVEERKTTEFRFDHADDRWVWLESRGRDLRADPRIDGLVVYTREVTDRKEYELELESRARQQAVIADLGRDALSNQDLDDLFAKATRLVAETLDTAYSKVLDLGAEETELLLRQGVGWRDGLIGSTTVPADDDESQAGYTLLAEEPVVVTDFEDETRFSGPELLTSHDVESGISTVIGSNEDPWGILGAHDTSTRSFDDEDINFVKSVSNVLAAAIERQSYQRELEDLVEKLEESNQRLEQFAYITSHDLQEPLRMISSYLRLLENRYVDQLDDDAEEFIEFAVDGAERMRQMINDLLEYSRLDTRAEPFEPTDTRTVVENALANLQVQIEENDADIDVGRLPTVPADSNQLEQVFQNLVSNAIKYRGEDPPEIEIGAGRDDDRWVFQVADNGIGMDPEHTDRIFDVFDRLHTHEEYPGTGIGLALCQKIIERHGGDIWVESEPGVGSTFYFTIPADEAVRDQRGSSGTTEARSEN